MKIKSNRADRLTNGGAGMPAIDQAAIMRAVRSFPENRRPKDAVQSFDPIEFRVRDVVLAAEAAGRMAAGTVTDVILEGFEPVLVDVSDPDSDKQDLRVPPSDPNSAYGLAMMAISLADEHHFDPFLILGGSEPIQLEARAIVEAARAAQAATA